MPKSEGCSGCVAAVEGELGSPSESIARCFFCLEGNIRIIRREWPLCHSAVGGWTLHGTPQGALPTIENKVVKNVAQGRGNPAPTDMDDFL
jgi:hypothetical protein